MEILVAAAETNNVELMRQVTVFLQDNRDLLKKPDVIEKVVKNLDKKNAKKLLDLVKGKFWRPAAHSQHFLNKIAFKSDYFPFLKSAYQWNIYY